MVSDVQWQNYLNEATEAVLTGDSIDGIRSKYGIQYKDDRALIELIETLDQSFVAVQPTTQFSNRLKDELIGVERTGVVWQIRRLPARVQWAAIVAATLGGVLLVLQRLTNAGDTFRSEERTSIPDES